MKHKKTTFVCVLQDFLNVMYADIKLLDFRLSLTLYVAKWQTISFVIKKGKVSRSTELQMLDYPQRDINYLYPLKYATI